MASSVSGMCEQASFCVTDAAHAAHFLVDRGSFAAKSLRPRDFTHISPKMTAQLVLSVAPLALLRSPLFGRAPEGQHRTAPAVALAGRRTAEGLEHAASLLKPPAPCRSTSRTCAASARATCRTAPLSATSCWTAAHNLTGRVVLVVDHGDECAFLPSGVAVAFAGPPKGRRRLARDAAYFSSALHRDSVVVTADAALRRRAAMARRGGCTS